MRGRRRARRRLARRAAGRRVRRSRSRPSSGRWCCSTGWRARARAPAAGPPTLLLLRVFPGALFFGAPYSESLFLLVSVGRVLRRAHRPLGLGRRRRGGGLGHPQRRARAAPAAGALLVARRSRAAVHADARLAPARAARPRWPTRPASGLGEGDALRFLGVAGRLVAGVRRAVRGRLGRRSWRRWTACASSLSGSAHAVYFEQAGGDPSGWPRINIMLFGFLVFAPWRRRSACCGACRVAYAAYVVAALALPLSFPVGPQPLMSLPRFLAVLFPIFMWLAAGRARSAAAPSTCAGASRPSAWGCSPPSSPAWHFIA